jgi:hypothetical protein
MVHLHQGIGIAMSLFETINALDVEQLSSVAQNLGVLPKNSTLEDSKASLKSLRAHGVKSTLIAFYNTQNKQGFSESYELLALWRDYTYEIIAKKKVKPENQNSKESILKELKGLNSQDALNNSDEVVSIVRDILRLLWQESSKKEKRRFTEIVKEDLEKHNQKLTDEKLNQSILYLLMGGAGGTVPIALPFISGIMLQQLTRGFIAWFLVSLMGQKAFQVAALGLATGPIGWGISMSAGGLSIILSIFKFKKSRGELRFVQAIFSIYSYRYQNQLEHRRQYS